jgi:hypothetical protein
VKEGDKQLLDGVTVVGHLDAMLPGKNDKAILV